MLVSPNLSVRENQILRNRLPKLKSMIEEQGRHSN
jgi:hypothetical protein